MKTTLLRSACILGISLALLSSCKTNSTSSNDSNNGTNSMVLTAGGTTYSLPAAASTSTKNGLTSLAITAYGTGANAGIGVTFAFTDIPDTGTYSMGTYSIVNGKPIGLSMDFYNNNTNANYYSQTSGTGTFHVTTLTATSIQGTFSGTLQLQSGPGAQTITITNGSVTAKIS